MRQSLDFDGYPRLRNGNYSSINPYDLGYHNPEEDYRREKMEQLYLQNEARRKATIDASI
jgi:hypothetical protein